MNPKETELKITVAKLIEIAYSQNKGMTSKIMRSVGNFTLKVDQNGEATLTGTAGMLFFSGEPALEAIGAKIKRVSIVFSKTSDSNIKYKAKFSLEIISLSISGSFDIEELITSCSGLLCKATRAMKLRNQRHEQQLQEIMGY